MGAQHPLRSMFTIAMTEKTASFLVKHLKHEIVPHEGDHPTFTLFAEASNVNWDDENEFPDSKVEELKVKVNTQLKLGYETVDDKLPFTLQQPVGVDQNKLETRVVSRNGERIAVSIEETDWLSARNRCLRHQCMWNRCVRKTWTRKRLQTK